MSDDETTGLWASVSKYMSGVKPVSAGECASQIGTQASKAWDKFKVETVAVQRALDTDVRDIPWGGMVDKAKADIAPFREDFAQATTDYMAGRGAENERVLEEAKAKGQEQPCAAAAGAVFGVAANMGGGTVGKIAKPLEWIGKAVQDGHALEKKGAKAVTGAVHRPAQPCAQCGAQGEQAALQRAQQERQAATSEANKPRQQPQRQQQQQANAGGGVPGDRALSPEENRKLADGWRSNSANQEGDRINGRNQQRPGPASVTEDSLAAAVPGFKPNDFAMKVQNEFEAMRTPQKAPTWDAAARNVAKREYGVDLVQEGLRGTGDYVQAGRGLIVKPPGT